MRGRYLPAPRADKTSLSEAPSGLSKVHAVGLIFVTLVAAHVVAFKCEVLVELHARLG